MAWNISYSPGLVANPDDWAARIQGALAFDAYESLTPGVNVDNPNSHGIFIDTGIKPNGRTGSARFPIPNSKGEGNGNVLLDFDDLGEGDEFVYQYRVYVPTDLAYQVFPTSTSHRGFKTSILAKNVTFTPGENALQSQSDGCPFGYWMDENGDLPTWTTTRSTEFSGSQLVHHNMIDNGSGLPGGVNPNNGSAWSSNQKDTARFGNLQALDTFANGFAYGVGQPIGGARRWGCDQWNTLQCHMRIGNFGVANSLIEWWHATESNPVPLKLFRTTTASLGDMGAYTRWWGTPFFSQRVAGGRRVSNRSNPISGLAIRSVCPGCPTGDWQIRYTATDKKCYLTPSTGGSEGAAVGFSASKLWGSLFDSNADNDYNTGRYIGVEITDFASLPSSDQTETFTIADGRNDTFMCVSEAIIKLGASLNFPGGYAAT